MSLGGGRENYLTQKLPPIPFGEKELDISEGSSYIWRTISRSRGRYLRGDRLELRTGPDAIVLDFWRQALEETDMALDFLPDQLSPMQLALAATSINRLWTRRGPEPT